MRARTVAILTDAYAEDRSGPGAVTDGPVRLDALLMPPVDGSTRSRPDDALCLVLWAGAWSRNRSSTTLALRANVQRQTFLLSSYEQVSPANSWAVLNTYCLLFLKALETCACLAACLHACDIVASMHRLGAEARSSSPQPCFHDRQTLNSASLMSCRCMFTWLQQLVATL